MLRSVLVVVALGVASASFVTACGGAPKQAEVPDVTTDTGVDMAGGDDSSGPPPGEAGDAKQEADAMRAKCCAECAAGLAKDRTGQPADKIPCSDFTDDLSPWCLEHFRGKPAMASECK